MLTLNQLLILALVSVPSVLLAYFGYRRSQKVDTIAAQAGIATATTASIQQVVDGLNTLVENLQEDNQVLRDKVRGLEERLAHIIAECVELRTEAHSLGEQVRRLFPT